MNSLPIRMVIAVAFLFAAMISTGCHLKPRLGPPGTIGAQREEALLHDPYPNNDIGPPILGSRPPGYERPFAETNRMQGPLSRNNRGGQVPQQYGF